MVRPAATGSANTAQSGQDLLGIYLNDHLAGAVVGTQLARRTAKAHQGTPAGETLERLAAEISEDRVALLEIMDTLGIPVRHYKLYAALAAERVGRLKPNGRLVERSPLSSVIELEMLRLGVEGKALGWRALRIVADSDSRLDAGWLDELTARAQRQADTLEVLRTSTVAEAFGAAVAS